MRLDELGLPLVSARDGLATRCRFPSHDLPTEVAYNREESKENQWTTEIQSCFTRAQQ